MLVLQNTNQIKSVHRFTQKTTKGFVSKQNGIHKTLYRLGPLFIKIIMESISGKVDEKIKFKLLAWFLF